VASAPRAGPADPGGSIDGPADPMSRMFVNMLAVFA
jgi:hypothetical protein